MKIVKSFMYGKYRGTAGGRISVEDREVAELLVKKGILESTEAVEKSGVNIGKDNKR